MPFAAASNTKTEMMVLKSRKQGVARQGPAEKAVSPSDAPSHL